MSFTSTAGPVGEVCDVALDEEICPVIDSLTEATLYGESNITASDAQAEDIFGTRVATSGENILVGTPFHDASGLSSGAAYLYRPDGLGGTIETKLLASDGEQGDQFGMDVALSGDNILVGAPGYDTDVFNAGAVYLYRPDDAGGLTETKITASDGQEADTFGRYVAMSGENLLVGARYQDAAGDRAGAAYLYQPDGAGGFVETKFTASDAASNDLYGSAVAIVGDTILIGAPLHDSGGSNAGAVYLYKSDGAGGFIETKITASDAQPGDLFGFSVALSGDAFLVGAIQIQGFETSAGAVYHYQPNLMGGFTETKITSSDGQSGDQFGTSVALAVGNILVGARHHDGTGLNTGAAYLYRPDGIGGLEETKLSTNDGQAYDNFGADVALIGHKSVVSAPGHDGAAVNAGVVYVFDPMAPLFGGQ